MPSADVLAAVPGSGRPIESQADLPMAIQQGRSGAVRALRAVSPRLGVEYLRNPSNLRADAASMISAIQGKDASEVNVDHLTVADFRPEILEAIRFSANDGTDQDAEQYFAEFAASQGMYESAGQAAVVLMDATPVLVSTPKGDSPTFNTLEELAAIVASGTRIPGRRTRESQDAMICVIQRFIKVVQSPAPATTE